MALVVPAFFIIFGYLLCKDTAVLDFAVIPVLKWYLLPKFPWIGDITYARFCIFTYCLPQRKLKTICEHHWHTTTACVGTACVARKYPLHCFLSLQAGWCATFTQLRAHLPAAVLLAVAQLEYQVDFPAASKTQSVWPQIGWYHIVAQPVRYQSNRKSTCDFNGDSFLQWHF